MLSFYEMTSRVARLLFTCYGESNSLYGRIGIFTLNEAQARFLYGLDAVDRDRPDEPSFRYPPLPTEAYRGLPGPTDAFCNLSKCMVAYFQRVVCLLLPGQVL